MRVCARERAGAGVHVRVREEGGEDEEGGWMDGWRGAWLEGLGEYVHVGF